MVRFSSPVIVDVVGVEEGQVANDVSGKYGPLPPPDPACTPSRSSLTPIHSLAGGAAGDHRYTCHRYQTQKGKILAASQQIIIIFILHRKMCCGCIVCDIVTSAVFLLMIVEQPRPLFADHCENHQSSVKSQIILIVYINK